MLPLRDRTAPPRSTRSSAARRRLVRTAAVSLVALLGFLAGCASQISGLLPGAIVGRAGAYDYSPSAIQTGNTEQFWWCGYAQNPNHPSQTSDAILYSTYDLATSKASRPQTVLAETPGTWDAAYTCNPQVVEGSFVNPLGNGTTYTYAMYYVGTALESGFANSIGVAFSNDGVHWDKYPNPVISTSTQAHYGVGQPVPCNTDHKAAITLFYEDSNSSTTQHVEAASTDGIHFHTVGRLTTQGLNPDNPNPSWGDMAYDPSSGDWYAAFNGRLRYPQTTGNRQERGQLGITLYRIPAASLLTGRTPWQQLHTFDTNSTGYESNFIAGFRRDRYGNLKLGPSGTIELYPSFSNPSPSWDASPGSAYRSAEPSTWDIGRLDWTPGHALLGLSAYSNGATQEVTTGWIDPRGGFALQSTLGSLYESPRNGATQAFYACKAGTKDYFISADPLCDGQRIIGLEGYGYARPQAAQTLSPLYSCSTHGGHFASTSPTCGNKAATPSLLGYIVPDHAG